MDMDETMKDNHLLASCGVGIVLLCWYSDHMWLNLAQQLRNLQELLKGGEEEQCQNHEIELLKGALRVLKFFSLQM